MKAAGCFRHIGRGSAPKPPFGLAFRSSHGFIVATICLAIFTDTFLYGLVVPVIPYSLTEQAGVPSDELQQWTAILLACYTIALCLGSPVVGIYADHTSSRRLPLLLGLLAQAGATVLLCLGRNIGLFVVGRILQGLSAAIVWSVGLALLADTVGNRIGAAMGYVNIAMSFGLLIAPLIGGAVYGAAGYYAVYYVAFALIACDIVLRLLLVEKKIAQRWVRDDETKAPVATANAAPDCLKQPCAAEETENSGTGKKDEAAIETREGETAAETGKDEASNVNGNAPEKTRPKYPMWTLIKSRRMLAALLGCVFEAGLMFSYDTVLPLFVKDTFNWSSTAAGLIFFCIFIPGFVSPYVGKLTDRYGAKWLAFAGFVASIPLLICLRFVTENTIRQKILLGALLALLGLTLTISNVPLMAEITFTIEAKEHRNPGIWGEKGVYGIGYGLFCTAFALGGTIGTLVSGYVKAEAGWGIMTWVIALWCASAAVVIALWVGGPRPNQSENSQDVQVSM